MSLTNILHNLFIGVHSTFNLFCTTAQCACLLRPSHPPPSLPPPGPDMFKYTLQSAPTESETKQLRYPADNQPFMVYKT